MIKLKTMRKISYNTPLDNPENIIKKTLRFHPAEEYYYFDLCNKMSLKTRTKYWEITIFKKHDITQEMIDTNKFPSHLGIKIAIPDELGLRLNNQPNKSYKFTFEYQEVYFKTTKIRRNYMWIVDAEIIE